MNSIWFDIIYFAGVLLFIVGLQRLGHPASARRGNLMAAAGMGISILASIFYPMEGSHGNYLWIFAGMGIGAVIGWLAAKRVQMTAMPQLVSLFNGLGGACAVVISLVQLIGAEQGATPMSQAELGTILLTLLVGSVAFTGSLIAWAKLDGRLKDNALVPPFPTIFNMALLLISLGLVIFMAVQGEVSMMWMGILLAISLVYGVTFVSPIGGADMPVVISLLNSFTGLTAALAGLIYSNQVMLMGGILVGSSGTILTVLMCQAMNRSLWNVIVGSFGASGGSGGGAASDGEQVAKELSKTDAAILLAYSSSVVIVPGYGLAVAQAQRACRDLDNELTARGVDVSYAIHPVAGRMPGHMNVLLAEVDVPYEKLMDLEQANNALPNTDVVIVVGANDVVNPSARTDTSSPIYGMPILNVDEAGKVLVMKRSMRPGYAGVQNPLFFHKKTHMLFGDAKKTLQELLEATKVGV
ncbi:MAG: NAD(P)(+) transhydrogenase (Re/Si-specific) subunit beta [Bacteroidota bacterium]